MMELVEIGDRLLVKEHHVPFDEFLSKKNIAPEGFGKLPAKDKDRIFLRWKHGYSNDTSNWEAQTTFNNLYGELDDKTVAECKDPYEKEYLQSLLNFERRCYAEAIKYGISVIRIKPASFMKWDKNVVAGD